MSSAPTWAFKEDWLKSIADGFYRYTDDLTFGTKYGVSNGKPSKTADNKVGICTGGGFIHLTARY